MNTVAYLSTPFAVVNMSWIPWDPPIGGTNIFSNEKVFTLEMYYDLEVGYVLKVYSGDLWECIPLVSNPELFDVWDTSLDIFIVEELPRFAAFLSDVFDEIEREREKLRVPSSDMDDIPF